MCKIRLYEGVVFGGLVASSLRSRLVASPPYFIFLSSIKNQLNKSLKKKNSRDTNIFVKKIYKLLMWRVVIGK